MSEFSAATPAPDPAQRLQPPGGGAILTLEAPALPSVVQVTQASEMAPPVTEEQEIMRTMGCGIAGLSIVADSLAAIKYAKVTPVRDETGLVMMLKKLHNCIVHK